MVNTERSAGNRAPAPQPPPPLDGDAVKQGAGAAAQNLKDQVEETAEQATEQAKQTAQSLLGTQKERVTQNLGALSDSLRQASTQLRESESGAFFAPSLDGAAARVQRVSGQLDEHEVSELFADLESYARKQPAVFLGGMFAAGALAARFLRSTGGSTTGGGRNVRAPAQTVSGPPAQRPRVATPQPQPQPRPGTPPAPGGASSGGTQADTPSPRGPLLPPRLDPRPGQRDAGPSRPEPPHDPRPPRQ